MKSFSIASELAYDTADMASPMFLQPWRIFASAIKLVSVTMQYYCNCVATYFCGHAVKYNLYEAYIPYLL